MLRRFLPSAAGRLSSLFACALLSSAWSSADSSAGANDQESGISGQIELETSLVRSRSIDPAEPDYRNGRKLKLEFEVPVTDAVSILTAFEHEHSESEFALDEAVVTLAPTDRLPLFFRAGKMTLPFGDFDSNLSQDSLLKELGEVKRPAVLVEWGQDGLAILPYVFHGAPEHSTGPATNYGVQVSYDPIESVQLKLDLIDNLLPGDTFRDVVGEGEGAWQARSGLAGLACQGMFETEVGFMALDYMVLEHSADIGLISYASNAVRPQVVKLEAGFRANAKGTSWLVSAALQATRGVALFELPASRIAIGATGMLRDGVQLKLEAWRDRGYRDEVDGKARTPLGIAAQLVFEF